jgi:hypothetical protein
MWKFVEWITYTHPFWEFNTNVERVLRRIMTNIRQFLPYLIPYMGNLCTGHGYCISYSTVFYLAGFKYTSINIVGIGRVTLFLRLVYPKFG